MKKSKDRQSAVFAVNGAGFIKVSRSDQWRCGGETGFSLDIDWGKHGWAGGVLPRSEAKNLALWILKNVSDK